MANYSTLKAAIQTVIKQNGNNEITGALLQQSLLSMITSLGAGYQFLGVATPSTIPGTPDQNAFYLCSPASYPNFGSDFVVRPSQIGILKYDGTWSLSLVASERFIININEYLQQTEAFSSIADARNAVPLARKSIGLIAVYLLPSGWYAEMFVGTNVSTQWTNNSYWIKIGDSKAAIKIIEHSSSPSGWKSYAQNLTTKVFYKFEIKCSSTFRIRATRPDGATIVRIVDINHRQIAQTDDLVSGVYYLESGGLDISYIQIGYNSAPVLCHIYEQPTFTQNPFTFSLADIDSITSAGTYQRVGYNSIPVDGLLFVSVEDGIIYQRYITSKIIQARKSTDNGTSWGDWQTMETTPIATIIHPQATSANYSVSLTKNKWYKMVFACENNATFKFFERISSVPQITRSVTGEILNEKAMSQGTYIIKAICDNDIDSIRIIGNTLGGVNVEIYEIDSDEKLFADACDNYGHIISPLVSIKLNAIQTWYSSFAAQLDSKKTYKMVVYSAANSSMRIRCSKPGVGSVDLYDVNGVKISSNGTDVHEITAGVYYVNADDNVTSVSLGQTTSPVVVEFYEQNTFVAKSFYNRFPGILPNYNNPSGMDVAYKLINGAYAASQFGQIYNFSDGASSHDATLIVINGYAYVVYAYDNGGGDSAYSPTCKVRLKKLNLSDTSDVVAYTIAEKDGVYGSFTQTGGAGQPNLYYKDGTLHIIYLANIDNDYVMMHTSLDTTTGTIGSYSKLTLTDGVNSGYLNQATLDLILNHDSGGVRHGMQMNCSVGYDNGIYYFGLSYTNVTAIIISTANFMDFTYVTIMPFDSSVFCEVACWCKDGYLYAIKRLPYIKGDADESIAANNPGVAPLAKYDISNKKWIAAVSVKNCSTRPTFFEISGQIYLITCGTTRSNAQIIAIDSTKLSNSKIICEIDDPVMNYPSVSVAGGEVYLIGTSNNTTIPLYLLDLAHYTREQIEQKILNMMV